MGDVVSYAFVMAAGAESASEHLQLGAFTAVAAVVLVAMGRRQRRTGRSLIAPDEAMRAGDRLIAAPAPSRGYRTAGCLCMVVGGVFALPAVYNLVAGFLALVG